MYQELKFILRYVCEVELNELAFCQLRSLWTSLCLRFDIDVDTGTYDDCLYRIWSAVIRNPTNLYRKDEFKDFDGFMCEYLV